jgi:hypothetical protein
MGKKGMYAKAIVMDTMILHEVASYNIINNIMRPRLGFEEKRLGSTEDG